MKREELRRKFRGALIGVAVGDALGAPFEGSGGAEPRFLDQLIAKRTRLKYTQAIRR